MNTAPEIRATPGALYPPGPRMLPGLLTGQAFRRNPVDVLTENARRYGDLVHFRGFEGHMYQFNHPALIQEIMQRARVLLGDGLLTSEEPLHMRQRRMAAPAFHRQRIAAYGGVIGQYAAEIMARWQPGQVDLHPQMLLLALRIVRKCLFNIDAESEAQKIASAVSAFMVPTPPAWIPYRLIEQLQKLSFGPMLKVRKRIDDLDRILYGMIAERRQSPGDRGDLLSMLLGAVDTGVSQVLERQ